MSLRLCYQELHKTFIPALVLTCDWGGLGLFDSRLVSLSIQVRAQTTASPLLFSLIPFSTLKHSILQSYHFSSYYEIVIQGGTLSKCECLVVPNFNPLYVVCMYCYIFHKCSKCAKILAEMSKWPLTEFYNCPGTLTRMPVVPDNLCQDTHSRLLWYITLLLYFYVYFLFLFFFFNTLYVI